MSEPKPGSGEPKPKRESFDFSKLEEQKEFEALPEDIQKPYLEQKQAEGEHENWEHGRQLVRANIERAVADAAMSEQARMILRSAREKIDDWKMFGNSMIRDVTAEFNGATAFEIKTALGHQAEQFTFFDQGESFPAVLLGTVGKTSEEKQHYVLIGSGILLFLNETNLRYFRDPNQNPERRPILLS